MLISVKKIFSSEFININIDTEICAVKVKKFTNPSDTLDLLTETSTLISLYVMLFTTLPLLTLSLLFTVLEI